MAVNSEKNYYINPKALSFTPNYQGYRNIVYVSIVSNAAIKAYHNDIDGLGYGMDAEYQTWRLSGTTTALGTASAYFIYARLSRTKQTADIIFSVRDYTVEGGYSYTDSEGNAQTVEKSDEYFYIKIGSLTETDIAGENATVNRVLTYVSGELGTDKQINEKSDSVFEQMFEFVSEGVEKLINVKEPFKSITVAGESLLKGLVTFVKGFVLGGKEITAIATSEDDYNEGVNDSTLPTTGYVDKEIEALDDHFLIKDDPDNNQSVAGPVTFEQDVTVQGDHTVKGDTDVQGITVHGQASMEGGATFGEFQDVAGNIQGAKVDDKGVGTFAGLKSKYFEIYELIYNQQTAEEGVKMFTDRGVIEEVKDITYYGNDRQGTYSDTDEYFKADALIKLRKERDGQLITFKKWDVIHGMVNSIGDSSEYAIGGEAWFRVVSVNQDAFEMEVEIYADRETPAGKNIAPTLSMVIARWGHKDGSTDDGLRRQTSFYLSCEDGNITQLMYVTKPIIGLNNYGSILGVLPPSLYEAVREEYDYVNKYQPYFYGRGVIVQDLMLLDYLGQPIKQARYRGVWNKNTAESDNPYVITASTYDTTTHNGSLWQLNADRTTVEPSDSSREWTKIVSKGDDSSIASYTIIPDPDKIHLATDGTLSTSTISVKIGEQLPDGTYTEIQDQEELEAKGFIVWYAVDGIGERTMLNISPAAIFELEDGSGRIITEEEGYLLLEGEEIDANTISSHIALYLVDSKGIDRAVSFIWIVKDGEKGESPLLVGATPSNLSVTIDAETGKTIEELEQIVRVFVQRGDNRLRPNDDKDGWVVGYDYDIIIGGSDVDDYVELRIEIPAGTHKSKIESVLNLTIYDRGGDVELGRTSITINKPERGIVGPMGNTGPLPYAAGAWNNTTEYPAATDIAPYVLYPNAENGLYYVRTANEIHKGEDGKDLNPAEESNYGSKGGWRVMPQYEVLFVKMLFANFGRLAKAVFHGDYMFSANGLASSGAYGSYDAFVDGNANNNEPMFDKNGRLSGSFVPNLFLDLENGQLKTNKLSETFVVHPSLDENGALLYSKQIELSESHNISVEYAEEPRVISMPYPTEVLYEDGTVAVGMPYEPDGVSSTVIIQPSLYYIQQKDLYFNQTMEHDLDFLQTSVILTSDGRLFDARSYKFDDGVYVFAPQNDPIYINGSNDGDGYFVINGKLTKILILEPASFVKLRSFTTTVPYGENQKRKARYWYVENGEDFAEINMTAKVTLWIGNVGSQLDEYAFQQGNIFASTGMYGAAYATKFLVDYLTKEEIDSNGNPTGHRTQIIYPYYTIGVNESGEIIGVEVENNFN